MGARSLALLLFALSVVHPAPFKTKESKQPNIVLIVADDLGFNDVSWNNPEVKSPVLGKMAQEGVILNRSYVMPTCTPSRSAFLTGRYPFKLGTQHGPFGELEPVGLPTDFKLLPEYLKRVGYKTHLVGKWHLGFCKKPYMPTERGFDSHYGYLLGFENYKEHVSWSTDLPSARGLDYRDGMIPVFDQNGTYSTYSFANRVNSLLTQHNKTRPIFLMYSFQSVHLPLEVPQRFYNMYPNITDNNRRIYLAMMSAMDEAVGKLLVSLKSNGMYDDTIFIFTSDNGGVIDSGGASNYPLTGHKDTFWEGGVRAAGFINSPLMTKGGCVENGYVHAVDWMPTILDLAGFDSEYLQLDGISHARTLFRGLPSRRFSFIVNIDEVGRNQAIVVGPWKLIIGSPEYCRSWNPNPCQRRVFLLRLTKYRLYHIGQDPSETKNLAHKYPSIRKRLELRLKSQRKFIRPSILPVDPVLAGDPNLWGGVWSPGWC